MKKSKWKLSPIGEKIEMKKSGRDEEPKKQKKTEPPRLD
jgi:hypothetical protein